MLVLTQVGTILFIGGLLAVSMLYLWPVLRPSRSTTYQSIFEEFDQLMRQETDPDVLLDRLISTLYSVWAVDGLSLWLYQAEDRTLTLHRWLGSAGAEVLSELPVDLDDLPEAWQVATLPSSALTLGLKSLGIKVGLSLTIGPNLVGILGLKPAMSTLDINRLSPLATQLALMVKNIFLEMELIETQQQLRRASRRAIDAQAEERRQLATQLHDEILGQLTVMGLTLRNSQKQIECDPHTVQGWLQTLETETQDLNHRLREITQGLHPSVLTNLGLISALQAYLDGMTKQPSSLLNITSVTVTAQGFASTRIADKKLEYDLYYIIRQALDNAIFHSFSDEIFVHLHWREDGVITMTVQDKGWGFNGDLETLIGQDGHLGLLSIQERVLVWGGQVDFYSEPQRGTTVYARLPANRPSLEPTHLQSFTHYLPAAGSILVDDAVEMAY